MITFTKKPSRPLASWHTRLNRLITQLAKRNRADIGYARANCQSIQRAVDGMGPDNSKIDPQAGARMVVNLSSAHIPAFCEASKQGQPVPYKNCYDLDQLAADKGLSRPVSENRKKVDVALPLPPGQTGANVYFGALELKGGGVRFYGDICLVLKRDQVPGHTVVLDRNSYDAIRPPISNQVDALPIGQQSAARRSLLGSWSGKWASDIGAIAAIKALLSLAQRDRRWTTGQICEAVREDEDYIEILKLGSFAAKDLQEARVFAADAAHDALIGTRLSKRPLPRLESMIWRNRRSHAESALRKVGVAVHIVTSSGRTKD